MTPTSQMMLHLYLRNKSLPGLGILGPGHELRAKVVDALEIIAVEEQRTNHQIEMELHKRS